MPRIFVIAFALLPTLAACGGSKESAGPNCSDIVFSPGGPVPKACVIEVPNGSDVTFADGGTTIVSVNGKVVATYPPCPCTGASTDRDGSGDAGTSDR
jgi:hypothetical protein